MSRLRVQKGHEKGLKTPAVLKIPALLAVIILIAVTRNMFILLGITAVLLLYLCTWPPKDILNVLKSACGAGIIAVLIFVPAVIMNPANLPNSLVTISKVLLSVSFVAVFNHTTEWNHITRALRQLHVPGIFVFTLDVTLKFIIQLGTLIVELLTSLSMRSVGKNNKKYTSIGGVMGVTFIKGIQRNREMYEAMVCRGFTDDYKGL